MVIALIIAITAVALFLIFRDDHDDSYTRSEKPKPVKKQASKPVQRQPATPPRPAMQTSRTIVPEEKQYRPRKLDERSSEFRYTEEFSGPDFSFLDQVPYDPELPERIMSSFIAGFHENVRPDDMGGVAGLIREDRDRGSLEVRTPDGRLLGHLPNRDRVPFHAINSQGRLCPFVGHVGVSTTGTWYADIRIAMPSSREFVERSLREFLGQ
jgi:hypothetical protein